MIYSAIIKELIAAGVSGDALVEAVERIESADRPQTSTLDGQAERRRAKDRERAKVRRQSADSADLGSPDKEKPPTPLRETNPSPEPIGSVSLSAREPDDVRFEKARLASGFEEFWQGWPHKVGKPAALKAFLVARRSFSLEALISGRDRYVAAKPPGRDWLNPATFFNQQRFLDEPAAVVEPAKREPPHDTIFRALAKVAKDGPGAVGWEAGSHGATNVTRLASPPRREPDYGARSSPKPRPHIAEAVARARGADGDSGGVAVGLPDTGTIGGADGVTGSSLLRGTG